MLRIDPSIKFVNFIATAQEIQIQPLNEDVGVHQVFLMSEN